MAIAPEVSVEHQWVTSGDMTLNGDDYIGVIKIRGNLVSTALRSVRGRPQHDIRCDCCGKLEYLGHILQVCPRTHASRIARHDQIINPVMSGAERISCAICCEPATPTPGGMRNDDLTILDLKIVADNADLEKTHHDKCIYYDVL